MCKKCSGVEGKGEIKEIYFFSLFLTIFSQLEAEAVPDVSEKYEITSVPTFLFFKV